MAYESQLSLLSRGPLFDPQVLSQYLRDSRGRHISQEHARAQAIADWLRDLEAGAATKETSLEQVFNHQILVMALGYELVPGEGPSAWAKLPTKVTGIPGRPDVALGSFLNGEVPTFTAVLELKAPGTDLDAPQSRTDPKSAVQQAFDYGERILGVEWVIVSDMRTLRLYSVESPAPSMFDLAQFVARGRRCVPRTLQLVGIRAFGRRWARRVDCALAREVGFSSARDSG